MPVSRTQDYAERKRFSVILDTISSVKRKSIDIRVQNFRNNGRSAGNIVKNLRENILKNSRFLICEALKNS
jgi:hypothetical protein